jgi:hypothetical protein
MSDVVNGQVVPALGQWQGALLIVVSLVAACVIRLIRRHR